MEHNTLMAYFVLLLCISLGLLLAWNLPTLSPDCPHITFRTSFLIALQWNLNCFSQEKCSIALYFANYMQSVCIIRAWSALRDPGVIHVDVEFCLSFTVSLTQDRGPVKNLVLTHLFKRRGKWVAL